MPKRLPVKPNDMLVLTSDRFTDKGPCEGRVKALHPNFISVSLADGDLNLPLHVLLHRRSEVKPHGRVFHIIE